jgi:FkbM family methyltransferase
MSIDRVIHNMVGYESAGMHFEGEIRALNRLADGVTSGVIVAIGSYRGQADCALALHAHVPVFCIDPRQSWTGESRAFGDVDRPYWMQNVMSLGLAEKVRPINLPSLDVAKIWTEPISFLWIDGNHVEVAADLDAWMPHVVDGGLVGVHDNNGPMIIAAVTARDDIVEIERTELTTIYRKEPLYAEHTYDNLTLLVRKGPYEHDDRYVLGEVRSYDLGSEPIRTCIDIGGMIGAFTAWVHQLYPDSQIVVIEPEISNQKILARNVGDLPGVTIINGRVNYDSQYAMLEVNPVNSGCHRIVPLDLVRPGQSVIPMAEPVTLESIMADMGWQTLDLLKVDCEGCEVDVLFNCTEEALLKIKRIAGEFHAGPQAFIEGIGARLQNLGFEVSAELNPASHATFSAINQNWQEEAPIEFGVPLDRKLKPGRKAKK